MTNSPDMEHNQIPWRFINILIAVSFGLALSAYFYHVNDKQVLIEEAHKNISAIADLKISQISGWINGEKNKMEAMRRNPLLVRGVEKFISTSSPELKKDILSWMNTFYAQHGYKNVFLIDKNFNTRLAAGGKAGHLTEYEIPFAREALRTKKAVFTDLHGEENLSGFFLDVFVPLSIEDKTAGLLYIRIDPATFLYPLIQTWPTPSPTAETLLVRREGNAVLYINELRHRKNSAFSLSFPLDETNRPAVMAVLGREGMVEGIDYRGVRVMAALKKVPAFQWFLVAKVDIDEINAPLREHAVYVGIIGVILISSAWVTAILLWRQQQAKYHALELERKVLVTHHDFLAKYANDMILLVDRDLKIVEANNRASDAYGYTHDELLTLSLKNIATEKNRSYLESSIRNLGKHAGTVFEDLHRRKDGTEFPVEVSARRIEIEGRTFYQCILRDITERKKMEAVLRDSENKFRTLAKQSPNMIFINAMGRFVYANRKCEEITQYTRDNFYSHDFDFSKLIAPESVPLMAENFRRHREGQDVPPCEYEIVARDGRRIPAIITTKLIPYAEGNAILGIITDITEQKHAEKTLGEEKERLAVTLRSIGDGVITTDAEGKVTLINKIAEDLTGWTEKEAVGKSMEEVFCVFNKDTGRRCGNPAEKVIKTGGVVGLANHTILLNRYGKEIIIADSGAPIRDRNNRIIGVVLVFRDVGEKEKLENELLKTRKLESLGILAGGIAHDFNNLLTGILGNVSLAKNLAPEGELQEILHSVAKASLKAKSLTQQLLTFAKGGIPVRRTVSIGDLLRETAVFTTSGSNVRCHFTIQKELHAVKADEGQISQVISNIVFNAIEAMPGGGILKITAENDGVTGKTSLPLKEGDYVKISFEDAGEGISDENLPRIFDPYFTTKQKKTGLGLATSYSIIQKHEGHISVKSGLGKGSVFSVYLPAVREKPRLRETKLMELKRGNGRILIMDDEEIVRSFLKNLLPKIGYDAEFAEDGSQAISLYKKARQSGRPFDVIILDLTVPGGKGGSETVREILEIDPSAKAIVSSGYSNDPIISNYRDYGFRDALIKPYKAEEISEILHRVLTLDSQVKHT